ncbi:unnamed protein product [Tuber aestivum]|uniref:Uncharacterized protein n=1 Tax=Tuber aestivum TaxID=59557 RepID=A0A292Q023_9PEZI|nr:unnamed protein product [Tuber aestivum]
MSRLNDYLPSFPKGGANPLSSHRGDMGFGTYGYDRSGAELGATILPDDGHSHSSLELPPQYGTPNSGSYIETSHTSFTNLSNAGGNLTQDPRSKAPRRLKQPDML